MTKAISRTSSELRYLNSKKRAIAQSYKKITKKSHDIQGIGLCLKLFGRFHTGEKETERKS